LLADADEGVDKAVELAARFPAFPGWGWTAEGMSNDACDDVSRVKDDRITGFIYRFVISLSEGEIEVEVVGDALCAVRKEILDQQS